MRCIVVRDEVSEDGFLIEGTNDWFAQAKDGTVWYCGEETAELETFKGDRPKRPEVVNIDGSFKAGRDGDKPGIIFLANPMPGQTYIEESSLGNAEDATQILSIDYSYGKNPKLDQLVPPQARAIAVRERLRRHQELLAARARSDSSASTTRPASAFSWRRPRKPARSCAS